MQWTFTVRRARLVNIISVCDRPNFTKKNTKILIKPKNMYISVLRQSRLQLKTV